MSGGSDAVRTNAAGPLARAASRGRWTNALGGDRGRVGDAVRIDLRGPLVCAGRGMAPRCTGAAKRRAWCLERVRDGVAHGAALRQSFGTYHERTCAGTRIVAGRRGFALVRLGCVGAPHDGELGLSAAARSWARSSPAAPSGPRRRPGRSRRGGSPRRRSASRRCRTGRCRRRASCRPAPGCRTRGTRCSSGAGRSCGRSRRRCAGRACAAALCPPVGLPGLGGVGKSQLAVEFAHRYGPWFAGGVFWLDCAEPASLDAQVARLGAEAALEVPERFAAMPLAEQCATVWRLWRSGVPRLLVFDNCEDDALLAALRPKQGGCRVLVTSRRSEFSAAHGLRPVRVEALPRAESLRSAGQVPPGSRGAGGAGRDRGGTGRPAAGAAPGRVFPAGEPLRRGGGCRSVYLAALRADGLDHASLVGALGASGVADVSPTGARPECGADLRAELGPAGPGGACGRAGAAGDGLRGVVRAAGADPARPAGPGGACAGRGRGGARGGGAGAAAGARARCGGAGRGRVAAPAGRGVRGGAGERSRRCAQRLWRGAVRTRSPSEPNGPAGVGRAPAAARRALARRNRTRA